MDNKTLLNATLIIQEVDSKKLDNGSVKYSLKMSDGKKYTIWKTKQDGTNTKAFETLNSFGFGAVGKQVDFGYEEKAGNAFVGKDGKTINPIYRTIKAIREHQEKQEASEDIGF